MSPRGLRRNGRKKEKRNTTIAHCRPTQNTMTKSHWRFQDISALTSLVSVTQPFCKLCPQQTRPLGGHYHFMKINPWSAWISPRTVIPFYCLMIQVFRSLKETNALNWASMDLQRANAYGQFHLLNHLYIWNLQTDSSDQWDCLDLPIVHMWHIENNSRHRSYSFNVKFSYFFVKYRILHECSCFIKFIKQVMYVNLCLF